MRKVLWGLLAVLVVAAIGGTVFISRMNAQNFVDDPSAPDYQNRIVALWPDDAVPDYQSAKYPLDVWPWYIRYLQKDDVAHKPYMLKYLVEGDGVEGEGPRPAVLIFPGGGYLIRAEKHEGIKMAKWLNSLGISAFVVNYRLIPYLHPVPLNDAQQAMRIVRARAADWNIDPNNVGVLGFSAGGHLAGLASNSGGADVRPDFAMIAYGVLAPEKFPLSYMEARTDVPVEDMSPNLLASAKSPPTFLWHTKEDPIVPFENATIYRDTLQEAGVPVELQLFETGTHGLGLAEDHDEASAWPSLAEAWLRGRGIIR